VLRKNRVEGAGGVFLCIRKTLDVSEVAELDFDAEIIWEKVSLSKRSPVYVSRSIVPQTSLLTP